MSIDMSQFYQVFFEETAEHLANMENLLLTLDVLEPDQEQLNAVFRAAHSIKGSSGTFGFTDLQDVTHILENLLDKVRKGELKLREDMIDAFLDAGDILKGMLAAHQGDGASDTDMAKAVCQRLRLLTENEAAAAATHAPAPEHAVSPAPTFADAAAAPAAALQCGFDLYFILEGDAATTEATLENLMAELAEQGDVRIVGRAASPDQPWHLQMGGVEDAELLRGMLEFVARNDSIRVTPLGEGGASDATDGAYGFFTDSVTPVAADESYGFFEPVGEAAGTAASDDAYGFFEPLPETPAPAPAASADESYGFFDPLPESEATPAAEPVKSETAEGAYGFFVDTATLPAATAAPSTVAPVVPVVEEKPAAVKRPAPVAAAKPGADTSIRVGVDKVDQLINLVGELVITQAMLAQSASQIDPVEFERLHNGLIQLERNTRDLQESVMSIRMMPMSVVFSRFPRVVRDLSQKLGKQVELKTSGESTELDRGLIERITDPLTHLIRNSLDHGIEMPDERAANGKQPVGTISLSAYHQSGNIVIEVGDDGAGLPRNKILAKAKERGFNVHDQMTDQEVYGLIFEAGFSTADQITEVSGRGVGMDVVKKNITAMGGRVEIDSMPGVGTRMTVKLPLTLAILDGMSVAVGNETYIIPLGYVIESLQVEHGMMKSVSGVERLIQVRDEYLPVVTLYEIFRVPGAITSFEEGIMIILEADGTKAALFVDAMVGQHQVVIKSLESNYRKVAGVSGATIMGDGRVALILDVSMLVSMARHALPAAA
ncbi:MAG: chemotaxis protein CheW [Rhodocyclaceae bacterium]|nr:chemotaxis protein CheW [Rhodocyclaceae bacterium]MDZ4215203.1 chemotaxis protein CheW [Rhodocyclaceae bacterium]